MLTRAHPEFSQRQAWLTLGTWPLPTMLKSDECSRFHISRFGFSGERQSQHFPSIHVHPCLQMQRDLKTIAVGNTMRLHFSATFFSAGTARPKAREAKRGLKQTPACLLAKPCPKPCPLPSHRRHRASIASMPMGPADLFACQHDVTFCSTVSNSQAAFPLPTALCLTSLSGHE